MGGEVLNRRADSCRAGDGHLGILFPKKLHCALDVFDRVRRIDYLRHGLGRGLATPCARRSAHACTSSARYTSPVRSISASAAKASFTRLRICSSYAACFSTASTMRLWTD